MSKISLGKVMAIVVLLLSIVFLVGYWKLGGFNPVRIELVAVDSYYLVGKYFQGSFKSDTIGYYFQEMNSHIENGVQGEPVIVYDQEPSGSRGISESFIGIKLTDIPPALSDLEVREISASGAIRVHKEAHISVMPNPDKIKLRIRDFAKAQGLTIDGPSIEIYKPDNRLVIEQPVAKAVHQ